MSWAYGWSGNSSNFLRNEVYDYSRNLLPEYDWSTDSVGKTDLLLISSHADDEQLFFAGIICALQMPKVNYSPVPQFTFPAGSDIIWMKSFLRGADYET